MNSKAEPLYFPSGPHELFGLLHAPSSPARDEGIVLCYPAPQETMRMHQAHVQLARQLTHLGYSVLRFDYSCTGDSDGKSEDMSFAAWERDVRAAVSFMKKRCGLQRIRLVGTRLGAALALRASAEGGISQLILWDPVIDGLSYLQAMEASHRAMLEREILEPPFPSPRYSEAQCWGFPSSAAFRSELAALSPALLHTYAKQVKIIHTLGDYSAWANSLREQGSQVELHPIEENIYWSDDRTMRMRCFPSLTLRTLIRLLETHAHG